MNMAIRAKGNASVIDVYVGKNLFKFRQLAGLSQQDLAEVSGVSFQQVQKYEKGTNRIAAGRLFEFSKILGVTPNDFFAGYNNFNSENNTHESEEKSGILIYLLEHTSELGTVIKTFSKIPNPEQRIVAAKAMNRLLKLFLDKLGK